MICATANDVRDPMSLKALFCSLVRPILEYAINGNEEVTCEIITSIPNGDTPLDIKIGKKIVCVFCFWLNACARCVIGKSARRTEVAIANFYLLYSHFWCATNLSYECR